MTAEELITHCHPERSEGSQTEVLRPFRPQDDNKIRRYFDAIAYRYDFLNHFLSFRLDDAWRRRALHSVLEGFETSLLDLGVGTGKFLRLFLEAKSWDQAWGLDFAPAMIEKARRELPHAARLARADFHELPFGRNSFDLVISSFVLRSVQDMPHFLENVFRVLKPEGKAAFLCLTRPAPGFFRFLYEIYLRFYLPVVGRIFSGHGDAYRFLSDSIMTFQEPERTAEMMRNAGFSETKVQPFSLGMVTLITGRKASRNDDD